MKQFLRNRLDQLHGNQSGAVALLMLAGVLILFMIALTLFDAGQASQDKMRVQIAADTASYSHSVIKSRTMNVIVYANIIKRFFYSYLVTYVHAWLAIIAEMASRAAGCFKWIPNPNDCYEFFAGLPMTIVEGIEALWNVSAMEAPKIIGDGRSGKEINQLDRYSEYMYSMTPWWAWIEATGRSMSNGAMVSASWPPPPSSIGNIKSAVTRIVGTIDWATGGNIMGSLPSLSNATDALPITRRDRQVRWSTKMQPFNFSISEGAIASAALYCGEYALSFEAIIPAFQTWKDSYDHPKGWKNIFIVAQLLPIIGCAAASFAYHDDGYLDWRVNKETFTDKNSWLQATSSVTLAYKPRSGTMDDEEGRKKFTYMKQDMVRSPLYENEGYFAMSRSELVYKQPFEALSFIGGIPGLSTRLGVQDRPDMWSPRWKAKNRPFALPGEQLGSSVQGINAGLGTIINDSVPFLMVGSVVGVVDPDFTIGSGFKDLKYLLRLGSSMGPENIEGVSK